MRIEFLGHAAFLITSKDGLEILIDPYESGGFGGRVGYAPICCAPDLVVITHDHLDHCHTTSLRGDFDVIRHEGSSHGIAVRSVPAFHDMEQGKRFGGVVDMKVFSVDGITLCHAGDLGEHLSSEHLRALGEIDIFIPPVGGFYTLDANDAARATRAVAPSVVIPCHFKTDRCGFDIAPAEPFAAQFSNVLDTGKSVYEVERESLPNALTCVVLAPSH